MTLRELLDYIEFDYEIDKESGKIRLIDKQHANLGGIEDELFDTVKDVVERTEIYWDDYENEAIANDIECDYEDWEDLYSKACKYYGKEVDEYTVLKWLIHPELVEMDKE